MSRGRIPMLKKRPKLTKKLAALIQTGNYASTACASVGVSESAYYDWLAKGDRDNEQGVESVYVEFSEAIKSAEADAEMEAVTAIRSAFTNSWQAAMTYLERRYPDRWGRRARVELGHGAGATAAPEPVNAAEFKRRALRLVEVAERLEDAELLEASDEAPDQNGTGN